jgi:hypothetical protein
MVTHDDLLVRPLLHVFANGVSRLSSHVAASYHTIFHFSRSNRKSGFCQKTFLDRNQICDLSFILYFKVNKVENTKNECPYIILTFSSNTAYPDLVTELKGVVVDYENKTWSFKGRIYKFADTRYIDRGCVYGPISVYDRNDIAQIKSMVWDWGDYVHSSMRNHLHH